jgi:hypothetical protein
MKSALVSVLILLTAATTAFADGANSLLFFSFEGARQNGYAGVGWIEAPAGLDGSGPVFSGEMGVGDEWRSHGSIMAGWRQVYGRATMTLLGGVEIGSQARFKASGDLWWDDAGWMATTRGEWTSDHASWRTAGGWRNTGTWPWIGPEISSKGDGLRLGAHATGITLPGKFESRVSAGWTSGDPYGELSLWRRF